MHVHLALPMQNARSESQDTTPSGAGVTAMPPTVPVGENPLHYPPPVVWIPGLRCRDRGRRSLLTVHKLMSDGLLCAELGLGAFVMTWDSHQCRLHHRPRGEVSDIRGDMMRIEHSLHRCFPGGRRQKGRHIVMGIVSQVR